jgi:hypothetical protein
MYEYLLEHPRAMALEENWAKVRTDPDIRKTITRHHLVVGVVLIVMWAMGSRHEEAIKAHSAIAEFCTTFMLVWSFVVEILEIFGAKARWCRVVSASMMVAYPLAWLLYLAMGMVEVRFFTALGPVAISWVVLSCVALPMLIYLHRSYFHAVGELVGSGGYRQVQQPGPVHSADSV